MTADTLFEILVYFAPGVSFVEISGMQVCGWLHEVSQLSACDIVSVQLACEHNILASSGQFGCGNLLSFSPASTMLVFLG